MSASYLADVERGARNISLDNIRRIADGFDLSVGELMETLRDYE